MRRAAHEGLNNSSARSYYPAQLKEAALLVAGVLKAPENWNSEINRYALFSVGVSLELSFYFSQRRRFYDPGCRIR